jgi:HD-GYP domain-containing protein (c-di-GMP phosphodiesterase class II)
LRVTLNVLLERVTGLLDVDAAAVLLVDPAMNTLAYAAGRGFRMSGITQLSLRLGEGHASRAVLERRPVRISDLTQVEVTSPLVDFIRDEGFTAYYAVPLIAKGQIRGVLEIFRRAPLDPDTEWLDFLETLAGQTAIAIDNAGLFESLERSNVELSLAYDATIEGWSRAIDLRDKETEGHTQRVTEMTLRLAREMGLREADFIHVRRGTLLHDIGKLGIPDAILFKPGPLTKAEWAIMRRHPQFAYDMIFPIEYLRPALDIPYCHHEKWDGSGYPRGLKGEQIPPMARIFAIVDVWDALRSDRPYRKAWTVRKTLKHIRSLTGVHFDPEVVEQFLRMIEQ